MKPSLQLKLTQHLALTPQLQQSIRLLQLSTLELEQELEKYLLENPLLERDEEYAPFEAPSRDSGVDESAAQGQSEERVESTLTDDDSWLGDEGSYAGSSGSFDDDEDGDYHDIQAATVSLREHLLTQLGLMTLPGRDSVLVRCLIEALDLSLIHI